MADTTKHMIHSLGASKSFGKLSLHAKVLWPMIISCCDDQGRFDADGDAVKWGICQNVNEIGAEDIAALLGEMVSQGMLYLYGTEDRYAQVVKWWPHQPMSYARPSDYPPPEGWVDRIRYRKGEDWVMENWEEEGGFVNGYPRDSEGIGKGYPKPSGQGKVKQGNVTQEPPTEPRKRGKRDERLDHWAIKCYQHVARKHVEIALRGRWIGFAEKEYMQGDDEQKFAAMEADLQDFIARGWYKGNIAWFMEWVEEGKPEKWKGGKDGTGRPRRKGHYERPEGYYEEALQAREAES